MKSDQPLVQMLSPESVDTSGPMPLELMWKTLMVVTPLTRSQ
ncbi:MAG: hypothetical protein U1F43_19810 [Myxococcota bacterium]